MKRAMAIAGAVMLMLVALPLFAQAPPEPLQDDLGDWMVGKWEGTTEYTMGKSNDEMEVDWDLEHQFLDFHYKQKMGEGTTAMAYKGRGMMTVNPQTKEFIVYWFGSFRDIATGKGTRTGNKITLTLEGGAGPETRTIEKVSDDKMVMTFKGTGMDGKEMSGTTTLLRKAKKEKTSKKG
ncbi:MAG: hypothetical protein ALAOOOJD_01979 [bacterium]|nr:hypothetical protein [bacterium]